MRKGDGIEMTKKYLTPEQIRDIALAYSAPYSEGLATEYEMALVREAVANHEKWMAEQCGEKPCIGCDTPLYLYNDLYDREDCERNCPEFKVYFNQQQGYIKGLAQAESRMKAREQEIYQFCVDWCEMTGNAFAFAEKYRIWKSGQGSTAFLCDLEAWLSKE